VALEAYANQDLPFEKLVEELKPERVLSHSPLFQVMLVLQNMRRENKRLDGLERRSMPLGTRTAKFDLSVFCVERQQVLTVAIEYNTDLFQPATIGRMAEHFQTLLEDIVSEPEKRIADLAILTQPELQEVLVEWNNTKQTYPMEWYLHELIETQAARIPHAVAVKYEDQHVTYHELNGRANQLAHYLQKLGIGPEVRVGIYLKRSPEMVLALLSTLKAGGAYVPLDPAHPRERVEFILEDAQIRALLTENLLREWLSPQSISVISIDSDWERIAKESNGNLRSWKTSDSTAYIIYTSGSTGKPKGVEVTNLGMANFVYWACSALSVDFKDRVLQFASISFDTAWEEIFPCLLGGGTLILRTDSMLDSIPAFLDKCSEWEITVLDLPTVYWHHLTEKLISEHLTIPKHVRLIIIGGDKCFTQRLKEWRNYVGDQIRLINTYGPTEGTVVATRFELTASVEADAPAAEVPIGRPIANVETYVLDAHLKPIPIGVPGELHIGGVGLARGYLNGAALTAERFIPNPFTNKLGARLYRTGDVARYLANGDLEFLDRMDRQVKIRGFRVEPAEIEAVLIEHQGVSDVVVVAREDQTGAKRLVAYLVVDRGVVPGPNEVREWLNQKLPHYMMPTVFVFLDALPVTANGKVDYDNLPVSAQERSGSEYSYVAPRTPLEKALVSIWEQVMEIEHVGIHDNFFELGGHSLLAVWLTSRIREMLKVELSLRTLFEKPTVAGLAESIGTVLWLARNQEDVANIPLNDQEEEIEL
jgi:amino acid adenylation domain-containing protein